MKKICWFLIIVLLIGYFAGCQNTQPPEPSKPTQPQDVPTENPDGTLSDEMKEEMLLWYINRGGRAQDFFWAEDNEGYGKLYCGTENGYVIYCSRGGMAVPVTIEIGEYKFSHSSEFHLRAYKDGEVFELKDLYEQGLISDDAIKAAWERHNAYKHR